MHQTEGACRMGMGATQHRGECNGCTTRSRDERPLWLPAITPAPVVAAAGESLTASALLPTVYGYTPEHHAGTRRERGRRSQKMWESNRAYSWTTKHRQGDKDRTRKREDILLGWLWIRWEEESQKPDEVKKNIFGSDCNMHREEMRKRQRNKKKRTKDIVPKAETVRERKKGSEEYTPE